MLHMRWYGDCRDRVRQIQEFFLKSFPTIDLPRKSSVVDSILQEFVGTKKIRLGACPNDASLRLMHNAIDRCVGEARPIPVLIPSAALKLPMGKEMDLAEFSVIRTLTCLQERVRAHYSPGLDVRFRMEDATEFVLSDGIVGLQQNIALYVRDFRALIRAMGCSGFLNPVCESEMCIPADFVARARELSYIFYEYLGDTDGQKGTHDGIASRKKLTALGWGSDVSQEMRDYLCARYSKLYPGMDTQGQRMAMARFFACILTRRRLNAVGDDPEWPGRLEISYAPPLPDTPLNGTRVYYRTVPKCQSANHLAFWQAKGFLKVVDKECIKIGLANHVDLNGCVRGVLSITGKEGAVNLRADVLL